MSNAITIRPGENFLLKLVLKNDDGSNVTVASLSAFQITAKNYRKLLKSWLWKPANAGDPHIVIVDGLATLEVEAGVTGNWSGTIDFEAVPSYTDASYFIEGSQVDVICFPGLLVVEKCLP